jgi:hypothetical protein
VKVVQAVVGVGALECFPCLARPNLCAVRHTHHGHLALNPDGSSQLLRHQQTTRRVQLNSMGVGEEKPLQSSLLRSSDGLRLKARHHVAEAVLTEEVEAAIDSE